TFNPTSSRIGNNDSSGGPLRSDISEPDVALGFSHSLGHEDAFPPPRLSAGYRLGKPTFAGTQGNGRDAPISGLPALAPEREGSDPKLSCHSSAKSAEAKRIPN